MLRLVALSAILGLFAGAASAQEVNGSVSGNVTDPSGGPISQATVKLVSEMNGAELVQSTNLQGEFTFAAVRPGIYTVTVEHPGFKQLRKQHFELAPGDVLGVGTFSLPVGSVSDSVSVQSEGSMVQTATSERAGIITSNEIQDLTVLNRDFTSFAELQPGVVITVGAQVQTFSGNNTFNVNGGRTTGNAFFID
jgi:Carboxypeptidase regulatory-like domain